MKRSIAEIIEAIKTKMVDPRVPPSDTSISDDLHELATEAGLIDRYPKNPNLVAVSHIGRAMMLILSGYMTKEDLLRIKAKADNEVNHSYESRIKTTMVS